MKEPLEFKSPNISLQNYISFTCSDTVVNTLFTILAELQMLGELGGSEWVNVGEHAYFFDGDGTDRVNYIKINGLSTKEWMEEKKRLGEWPKEDDEQDQPLIKFGGDTNEAPEE